MNALIMTLRLIHILAAMFWFGGTVVLVRYVLPTARRIGPAGGPFMQSLTAESGMPITLTLAGWAAIIAGIVLMVLVSNGFSPSWTRSPMGITFSLGAAFGLLAGLHGSFVQAANARRMAAVAKEISASGGPPGPEQIAAINTLRDKLEKGGNATLVLLAAAAIGMAIARYV